MVKRTDEQISKTATDIVVWELKREKKSKGVEVKTVIKPWTIVKNFDTKDMVTIVALDDGFVYFVRTLDYNIHSINKEPFLAIFVDGSLTGDTKW